MATKADVSKKIVDLFIKFQNKEGRCVNGYFHNISNSVIAMKNDVITITTANKKIVVATPDDQGGYQYDLILLTATAGKRISELASAIDLGFELLWEDGRPWLKVNNEIKPIKRGIYTDKELANMAIGE